MAKILYVVKYPLDRPYSIMQKLDGQMAALRALGHEVDFISFDSGHIYLDHGTSREVIRRTTMGKSPVYYHLLAFYDIYSAAKKLLRQDHYDLVYFRYGPLNQAGARLFRTAAARSRLVVEIPTFPPESETQKSAARRLYMDHSYRMWRKNARCVSLFTAIGEKAEEYLGVPLLNIDNGVSMEAIPLKKDTTPPDGKIHLLAVASMCTWHGYDRLIKGFAEWDDPAKGNYVLDFVGNDGDGSLESWKMLSEQCGITENVVFHGSRTGRELSDLYDMASIGISSLGMYRNGFTYGSVLKLREYMARGLPFIYAHDDPDMTDDMPWCLKVPNNDSPIEMDKVIAFIDKVSHIDDISVRMREHAAVHMSWERQFNKMFEVLNAAGGK